MHRFCTEAIEGWVAKAFHNCRDSQILRKLLQIFEDLDVCPNFCLKGRLKIIYEYLNHYFVGTRVASH